MNIENIIEFEVRSKVNEDISISGYVDYNELDDDEPLWFYDQFGLESSNRVPKNPYREDRGELEEYEKVKGAFQSDVLFLQYLADFHDENKTVDRGDYLLIINA